RSWRRASRDRSLAEKQREAPCGVSPMRFVMVIPAPLLAAGAATRAAKTVDLGDAERRPPERRIAARRILGADVGDAGVAAASFTLGRARRAHAVALAARQGRGGGARRGRGRGGG